MKNYIENYNWDNGHQKMEKYIDSNSLSSEDILQVFYDAGGYEILIKGIEDIGDFSAEHYKFLRKLVDIINEKVEGETMSKANIEFELTRVQKYKIAKKNPKLNTYFWDIM